MDIGIKPFFKNMTSLGSGYFYGIVIISFIILGYIHLAIKLVLGFIIAYILTIGIRSIYYKERPDKENYTNWISKISSSSFPSMHSLCASFMATFFSITFGSINLGIFLGIIALLVSYSRVYLKRHYLNDVIIGIILGVIMGIILA